jgi:UDP-3-O-[3-hydroxymyristoyl] N-acetylglucosamine deacetylase
MSKKNLFLSQHTIASEVSATGVGLHSGKKVKFILKPAPINTGIVFFRGDLAAPAQFKKGIQIHPESVFDTRMASTIGEPNYKISTVEHFMAACAGLAVDNLYVEVFGEEMPIMDGSSASFVFLIQSVGVMTQAEPRQFLRIRKNIRVEEGEGKEMKWAQFNPCEQDHFQLVFDISFNNPAIDQTGRHMELTFSRSNFLDDIARARTFGFAHEVEYLRDRGLANGGGLHNAIVIDESKILNQGGLRIDGEFVRHKMLDAIGDLYLAGAPLLGEYIASRSGHALNNKLLRALFADSNNFEKVSLFHNNKSKEGYHSFENIDPWS